MSARYVLIVVDGREVVVRRERLTGRTVLASVGAHPVRGDVLIRDNGGSAHVLNADDLVEISGKALAAFRVQRCGRVSP